ncbi:MAG: hypothetical protein IJ521_05025 [Schwartzia sp.]|nr:hypothetical protein [Schwartzia sp. (in: firmicutes)]
MGEKMTNEEFCGVVNREKRRGKGIIMVTLYEHPKDFPESYVARVHFVEKGRQWASPDIFIVHDTLEAARAAVPSGMVNMGRSPMDDPCIVETYI